jgi:hypothetical protein
MFIDRLNLLIARLELPYRAENSTEDFHRVLDALDKHVGIITRKSYYPYIGAPVPRDEYVGARLRRLERHVEANTAPPYFWLGADAE